MRPRVGRDLAATHPPRRRSLRRRTDFLGHDSRRRDFFGRRRLGRRGLGGRRELLHRGRDLGRRRDVFDHRRQLDRQRDQSARRFLERLRLRQLPQRFDFRELSLRGPDFRRLDQHRDHGTRRFLERLGLRERLRRLDLRRFDFRRFDFRRLDLRRLHRRPLGLERLGFRQMRNRRRRHDRGRRPDRGRRREHYRCSQRRCRFEAPQGRDDVGGTRRRLLSPLARGVPRLRWPEELEDAEDQQHTGAADHDEDEALFAQHARTATARLTDDHASMRSGGLLCVGSP